jgi:hypothetical protein
MRGGDRTPNRTVACATYLYYNPRCQLPLEDVPMASLVESLPQTGQLEVDIRVRADVNISAYAARQKVNSFVLSDISTMMHAGVPTLVVAERICWRVPVILSLTSQGDVGEVGTIDVDVETGQMHITPQLITEINTRAEGLALSATSEPAE